MKFPIPKVIYKNIKDTLNGNIYRLAKDIAKTLDVDEKLLLNEIKKDTFHIYPFDEEDDDQPDLDEMKCLSYIKKDNIYYPCKEPPIYPQMFCHNHLHNHITKDVIKDYTVLSILMYGNETHYLDKKNRVYNVGFKLIGIFNEESNSIITFKHIS